MDFIINTPYHKRWWLPDRVHAYNSVIQDSFEMIAIIHVRSGDIVKSHYLKMEPKAQWEDLSELAQQLAWKEYQPKLMLRREALMFKHYGDRRR